MKKETKSPSPLPSSTHRDRRTDGKEEEEEEEVDADDFLKRGPKGTSYEPGSDVDALTVVRV